MKVQAHAVRGALEYRVLESRIAAVGDLPYFTASRRQSYRPGIPTDDHLGRIFRRGGCMDYAV